MACVLTCLRMDSVQAETSCIDARVVIWIQIKLCCVILNKCYFFSNKHNAVASIKITRISTKYRNVNHRLFMFIGESIFLFICWLKTLHSHSVFALINTSYFRFFNKQSYTHAFTYLSLHSVPIASFISQHPKPLPVDRSKVQFHVKNWHLPYNFQIKTTFFTIWVAESLQGWLTWKSITVLSYTLLKYYITKQLFPEDWCQICTQFHKWRASVCHKIIPLFKNRHKRNGRKPCTLVMCYAGNMLPAEFYCMPAEWMI